ncbi:MAG: hypothetical protein RL557_461 [archaeon]
MINQNHVVKKLVVTFFLLSCISVFAMLVFSQSTFNVCCERTLSGAWCQNTIESDCDLNYRKTPTSCDATSFCKLGVCVDTDEGLCMDNTPQKVCEISEGTWIDGEPEEIPQCELGCCMIGDQASFVTLTRCKRLSRIYGLETNFKKDVTDEVQCILLAQASDKGACVFEIDGERTCKFMTRQECLDSTKAGNITQEAEFFKDYLCTADELATNCGPTEETICVDGKDEVYFKDTCGNAANIYDGNRVYSKDSSYWKKVVTKPDSCGPGNGNINSKTCGNCDYLKGSVCGKGNAAYGDFICKDLNCYNTKNGKSYKNGESWCESIGEGGSGQDPVGNRYFRHVCIQGEETIEPCADFRNEVCIEQAHENSDFIEAACRVNRWTDCIDQLEEEDCLNTDRRDCLWASGVHYDGSGSASSTAIGSETSTDTENQNKGVLAGGHICLPNYPPGLEFWKDSNAKQICSLGNSKQVVNFNTDIFGTKTCEENCDVLETSWVTSMNKVCVSLGDCGAKTNIAGRYTDDGIAWKQNGSRKNIVTGVLEDVQESSETTSVAIESSSSGTSTGSPSSTSGSSSSTTSTTNENKMFNQ